MRKTTAPGSVSNAFVDKNLPSQPTGTRMSADWMNDVQNELIGIQDEFSIAEAAGTNKYILSAMKGIAIGYGKPLGELFYLDSAKDPVEFDKDDPTTFFPGKCLDTIEDYEDISSTNFPLLVPHLRAKALTFFDGITGEKSAFNVTGWSISSNVAQLTFNGTTGEDAMLAGLSEDNLVHGGFASWRSVTLASAIGSVPAGEYAITDIDVAGRTIEFACVASNGSGSGTFTVNFYENRVPGSTTTARLYQSTGRTLVSANDGDGECISGLRRRDRLEYHAHQIESQIGGPVDIWDGTAGAGISTSRFSGGDTGGDDTSVEIAAVKDDPNASVSARSGSTTDPRSLIGHLYIWGQKYVA